MIKYLFLKASIILRYILLVSFFFIVIEFISRGFIWAVTKDSKTLSYGFNKDIKIDIFHLRKLDIKLTDLHLINQFSLKNKSEAKKKNTNENIKIWFFGGSTTAGRFCGKNASSWPEELVKLNNEINIYDFGEAGIDSEYSLYNFRQAILEKKPPNLVIWVHKFNEINVIYQGLKANKQEINYTFSNQHKKKLNLILLKVDTTFKNNFLSYKILDNFILSVSRKIIRNFGEERINKNLNDKDFEYASINYKLNTMQAIKLSKENNVEKFILVSLPSRIDYEEKMKNFFNYYYQRVEELTKDDYVDFIDISKYPAIKKENENLFCDEMHKTRRGNIIVAEILSEYLF